GVTVAKKGFMQNEFQAYSSVFILLDYMPFQVHRSDEIKEGMFACVYHHGPYEETDETYKKLMKYIDQEGYKIDGDAIEIALIDWSVTENPDEQVTEIQIPVVKK
ncbi:GyrI-like domain-containing protein, partial [Bacillus anthracis]